MHVMDCPDFAARSFEGFLIGCITPFFHQKLEMLRFYFLDQVSIPRHAYSQISPVSLAKSLYNIEKSRLTLLIGLKTVIATNKRTFNHNDSTDFQTN
jgi:hypothetical protein